MKELSRVGKKSPKKPNFTLRQVFVIYDMATFNVVLEIFTKLLHKLVKISNDYSQPKNEEDLLSINAAMKFKGTLYVYVYICVYVYIYISYIVLVHAQCMQHKCLFIWEVSSLNSK